MASPEEQLTKKYVPPANRGNVAINAASKRGSNRPPHKPACDRCKGQKLRCVWDGSDICRRCSRARAVCQLPVPRPYGRPRRAAIINFDRSAPVQANADDWTHGVVDDVTSTSMSEDDYPDPLSLTSEFNPNIPLSPPRTSPFPSQANVYDWESSLFLGSADTHIGDSSAAYLSHPSIDTLNITTTGEAMAPGIAPVPSEAPFLPNLDSNFTLDEPESNHLQWLMRLSELNLALYKHPLHPKPPSPPPTGFSYPSSANSGGGSSSIESPTFPSTPKTLSDLHIGDLLDMTGQLRRLTKHTDLSVPDRSTLFTVLGCYVRLELIYTHALVALAEIKNTAPVIENEGQVITQLAVDGRPLDCCPMMQLDFLIYMCEQSLIKVRQRITSLHASM